MSFAKLRRAKKLANISKMHIAYLATLDTKEYDIPDDTPEKKIDAVLDRLVIQDMELHKLSCPGCLPETEFKAKLKEKFGLK